jgi:hypothetical protein
MTITKEHEMLQLLAHYKKGSHNPYTIAIDWIVLFHFSQLLTALIAETDFPLTAGLK